MGSYKTSMRIVLSHRVYIVIYLVLMTAVGLTIGMLTQPGSTATFKPTVTRVAVVDHDGSTLSRALASRIYKGNEKVTLDGSKRATQDAIAKDSVSYLLVIPEGWGDGFMAAARSGKKAPTLNSSVSYSSGEGRLVELTASSYSNMLYQMAATLGGSQEDVVSASDSAWKGDVSVDVVKSKATPLPASLRVAAEFSSYSIFASVTVVIAVLMQALNRPEVARRRMASSQPAHVRSASLLAACLTIALVAWIFNFGLQVLLLGRDATTTAPLQLAMVGAAELSYSLFSAAVGFLIGQIGLSENASNAVANIFGMVFSFMGGAWTGLSLLPDSLLAVAHFMPSYWTTLAIEGASNMETVTSAAMGSLLGDVGICALFSVAILLVGLVVGRDRSAGRSS
ncbi:MAG: ABC transporter permease [Coriobacteriaceae bacterium]|nr:MAG: ABC transporter permease [Coriobacteriaceae bacterium]